MPPSETFCFSLLHQAPKITHLKRRPEDLSGTPGFPLLVQGEAEGHRVRDEGLCPGGQTKEGERRRRRRRRRE